MAQQANGNDAALGFEAGLRAASGCAKTPAGSSAFRPQATPTTPGCHVGAAATEDDGEDFEEKMRRLVARLRRQQAESARLVTAIAPNLKSPCFEDRAP